MKKIVSYTLIILISLLGVYFFNNKTSIETAIEQTINLTLTQNKPELLEISEEEAKSIKQVIATFEEHKYKKDFVAAINMLTTPENQEEKDSLDHYLGNDLAMFNNGKPSPRFFNKDKFHFLVGFDIEKIINNDGVTVFVKELRVVNVAEEGANPKYEAQEQKLNFELIKSESNYKISKYYHANATSIANQKYEGFIAY